MIKIDSRCVRKKRLPHRGCLIVAAFPALLGVALPACTSSDRARSAGDVRVETLPEVDSSRASLPESKIEPVPARPTRPVTLKALSERASRQIARARSLVEQQRYTEAAIELERALRYDPNHPEIHRTLATLHWQAGNVERAEIHAERTLEGNRDDAVGHYLLGRCLSLQGNSLSAMQSLRTALRCSDFEQSGDVAVLGHYYLAESLAAERYLEAALGQYSAFERAVAARGNAVAEPDLAALLQANHGLAGRPKANIYEKLARFSEAAAALAPLVSADPDDVSLGLRHARLLLRAKKLDAALAATRALPFEDDSVIALLAEIYELTGDSERMIEDLRGRLAKRPGDPSLIVHLADALLRFERAGEAVDELKAHLAHNHNAYSVRLRLIDLFLNASQWSDALRACGGGVAEDRLRSADFEAKILSLSDKPNAVTALLDVSGKDDTPSASYLRGLLALKLRRHDEAQRWLRQAYAADGTSSAVRVALARVYLQKYQYADALKVAARSDPDIAEGAALELVLGVIHERLDDVERAEAHFRAANQLDRTDARPMLALARLYRHSHRQLQAQRQLRVLLDQFPDDGEARELLASSYFADGQFDAAVEQFEALSRRASTPNAQARAEAVLAFLVRQQDPQAYRDALQEAMRVNGEDVETWLAWAESYPTESDPQARGRAFRRALELDPDEERARLGLVDTSRRALEFEETAKHLEHLLRRRPHRVRFHLSLIDLYWTLQRRDDALALARRGAEREEADETEKRLFRRAIVDGLRFAGRTDEIVHTLRTYIHDDPGYPDWSFLLAEEHLRQDRPGNAVAVLQSLYADKDDWPTLLALIAALEEAKEHDRATQYLLNRLNDDPENDAAISRLARVLADAERFDEALELIHNRQLLTFQRGAFQDEELMVLQRAKRYEDCLDRIDELLEQVASLVRAAHQGRGRVPRDAAEDRPLVSLPDEPFTLKKLVPRLMRLRLWLSTVLILSEEYRTAERQLNEWLEEARDPGERVGYLRQLSFCHRAGGNDEKATEVLARALLLRPRNSGLNNDVAYGWIDAGIRIEEAEPMIRLAVWQNPRNAAFLDTFGWLLYKKGDFVEAKKWLLRSKGARQGDDAVVIDHLGDACWRLGDRAEAIANWEEAVKAVGERPADAPPNADEDRVRQITPTKIKDARAGREPKVAGLQAVNSAQPDTTTDDAPSEP